MVTKLNEEELKKDLKVRRKSAKIRQQNFLEKKGISTILKEER